MDNYFPVTHSTLSIEALMVKLLSDYDIDVPTEGKLISPKMNDTYQVKTKDKKYILRVYRAGWRSLSDILYEFDVLLHLNRLGIAVSIPLPRKDGTLTSTVTALEGLRYIALFTYAPGTELNYDSEAEDASYQYGTTVAAIHTATETFHSHHPRFSLDLAHLLDAPLRALQPLVADRAEDWEFLQALAQKLRGHMGQIPIEELEQGFCHGDSHGWNVHTENQTVTAFDFDCCGQGWRAYDLAVFRWGARLRGKENERWPPFLRGYQAVRPISDIDIAAIPYFVALRHFWFLGVDAANGQDWGFGSMDDWYFDHYIKFLRTWEKEYLIGKSTESNM
jgi:Ser/Thr protein kinase RdoA (MazF antagonist)